MKQHQLPNGIVIELPDDATLEEIQAIADELSPPDDGRSDLGAAVSALGARGPAYMLGGPMDMATGVLNDPVRALGNLFSPMSSSLAGLSDEPPIAGAGIENPPGGSQWWMDRMEDVGIPTNVEASTPMGRIVARMLEEVGAFGAGAGVGGAARLSGLGSRVPAIGRIAELLTEAPVTQTAASAAAGLGAGIGNEIDPGNPFAELVGALAGGIPASLAGTAANRIGAQMVEGGRDLMSPFTQAGRERMASSTLQGFASDPQAAAAEIRANLPGEIVPGSVPMTADLANDTGLSTAMRALSQDSRSPLHGLYDQRLNENDLMRRRLLDQVGRNVDTEAAGGVLRDEFDRLYGDARQATHRAYQAVQGGDIPVGNASGTANMLLREYFGPGGGNPPNDLAEIVVMLGSGDTLPYETLQRMRSRAQTVATQASSGANPDRRVASVAGQITDLIDNAIRDGLPNQQAADFTAAQQARATQGQTFEQGPLGPLSQTTRGGPRVAESAIPPRIANSYESGLQAGQTFAGSQPAQQAIRDYLVSRFTDTRTGRIGPVETQRFWRTFGDGIRGLEQSGVISPDHAGILRNVTEDIGRHHQAMARGTGRGSSTMQNLTIGQALDDMSGGLLPNAVSDNGGVLMRQINEVYRGQRERVQALIAQAMMDPELAAMMLERQTPEVWSRFGELLRNKLGVTLGVSTLTTLQGQ